MPDPTILAIGPIAVRSNTLAAGAEVAGHKHKFDHVTYCRQGEMTVAWQEPGGERQRVLRATDMRPYILIPAGVEHRLVGLVDGTIYDCIYAHRGKRGEVVEHYTGREDAYV